MATKIRKSQIKTEEFIIPYSSDPSWTSENETASQLAIDNRILATLAGVTGSMVYKGAWNTVPANGVGVKKGWVYVYDGNGTAPTGVSLERGDTLIANQDTANPTNSSHWTIVQSNIDESWMWNKVKSMLVQGDNVTLSKNDGTQKITVSFSPVYPTISQGAPVNGSYVSGLSISGGVIKVSRSVIPDQSVGNFITESFVGERNGANVTFNISYKPIFVFGVYINGVQMAPTDYSINESSLTITGGYIPDELDDFWIVYLYR